MRRELRNRAIETIFWIVVFLFVFLYLLASLG